MRQFQIEDGLQDSWLNPKIEDVTETREIWQLNSVWDSGLDHEAKKKKFKKRTLLRKTGKILMRSVD